MMIDRVSPPAGMRPLSLIRPSAWPGEAGSGGQRIGGSWPRWSPSGESGCICGLAGPAVTGWSPCHRGKGVSARGGERVVAELSEDVMGLAEDLAGLGQRGALAVAAVLDLGVVAVVGG
jgi:hypothetical protein